MNILVLLIVLLLLFGGGVFTSVARQWGWSWWGSFSLGADCHVIDRPGIGSRGKGSIERADSSARRILSSDRAEREPSPPRMSIGRLPATPLCRFRETSPRDG